MSKVDPTGMDAVLAAIPKGQLSERQQRIAAGVALVKEQGFSCKAAAKRVGIPHATLWRYHRDNVTLKPEQGLERDTEDIAEASADIALMAAEAIKDSLSNHVEDWRPIDLVKAYGVATDKIIALGDKKSGPVSGITELFSRIIQDNELVVRKRDRMLDAIEVEAERE